MRSGAVACTSASICGLRDLISSSSGFHRRARSRSDSFMLASSIRSGSLAECDQIIGLGAKSQASVDQGAFGEVDQLVAQR